jgi:hypothetical protein
VAEKIKIKMGKTLREKPEDLWFGGRWKSSMRVWRWGTISGVNPVAPIKDIFYY